VELEDIDTDSYDLSVKNPNRNDEVILRSPKAIMEEIVALDAESVDILTGIRGML